MNAVAGLISLLATPLGAVLTWSSQRRAWLAAASFALGVASFALMQRDETVARWVVALLGVCWLLMLAEGALGRLWRGRRWAHLPPILLRYATQAVHQQSFFFCLPFFFYTTTWSSGQAAFTLLLTAAAVAGLWDPLYYRVIAARPALYFAYHALAVYASALTLPPILWQLTTTQSLAIASAAIGLLALPSLAQLLIRGQPWRWLWLPLLGLALGGAAWLARAWVPPATLWVTGARITTELDSGQRQPGLPLRRVPASDLAGGLYAYTAIHAPRGLHERVFHCWRHRGQVVDCIPLTIAGGREHGYRAWSYKRHFPPDAAGRWTVDVVTGVGQLIGRLRFRVVPDGPVPAPTLSTGPPAAAS